MLFDHTSVTPRGAEGIRMALDPGARSSYGRGYSSTTDLQPMKCWSQRALARDAGVSSYHHCRSGQGARYGISTEAAQQLVRAPGVWWILWYRDMPGCANRGRGLHRRRSGVRQLAGIAPKILGP